MRTEVKSSELNVLVVEDDEKTFRNIRDAFANTEYKLCRANTGNQALRLAREGYFIAVITELRLSDINGIELIRRLKKTLRSINVIVLTTYTFTDATVEALKEGAYAYVMKPLNTEEIRLVLRRAIENSMLVAQAKRKGYYQDISAMDGLTGVYNHRHFYEILDWNVTHLRRSPQAFSLFITDIDDFKKYNDTHGHVEGDKVLHNTAQLLVESTRENDMVFRYGGEEFALILPQTDKKNAQRAGERILMTIRGRMPVTISIGLATFPVDAQTKNDLVVRADKALYRAKASGKNRICVFDERLDI